MGCWWERICAPTFCALDVYELRQPRSGFDRYGSASLRDAIQKRIEAYTMGEMAEYYLEQAMFHDLVHYFDREIERRIRQQNRPKWVCKDGRKLYPKEMSVQHLKNSIAMIERRQNWRRDWLVPLKLELVRRQS